VQFVRPTSSGGRVNQWPGDRVVAAINLGARGNIVRQ